ncbi:alkanesulfonates transport system permease protein [Gracilibacillus boraciitolerans JCM 21714]|uniref:Alkanesulfonates transport system permease protein n=1 Tax=Gracilibacillus boraciitolerans JCM 21714 TaxID=1298598 RepID=W4VH99_9BACI|nr:ABC transporter permease [Gracilibacillus boraciitolerans]GAE92775.1 alkanesulfonates transport system permease protein [Gracilibacillus boraciitolerans JCM 21714]
MTEQQNSTAAGYASPAQAKVKLDEKKDSLKKNKGSLLQTVLYGSIIPVALIVLWELLSRAGIVPTNQLPAPTTILDKIISLGQDGSLWGHIWITTYRVFAGFIIGTIAAIVLGSIVGFYKIAEQLFDPMIQAFRSIPSLAWVPLFILWMGIGETSKIVMIAVGGVFFPVYLNIVSGILGVDRKLIEVGKMYGLKTFQLVKRIILPASLPSFLVGMRSGLGLGWMFVVAAELMGASQGLGFLLVFGQNMSSPETILASIILFAIIGKLSDWILKQVEVRSLHWQDRLEK